MIPVDETVSSPVSGTRDSSPPSSTGGRCRVAAMPRPKLAWPDFDRELEEAVVEREAGAAVGAQELLAPDAGLELDLEREGPGCGVDLADGGHRTGRGVDAVAAAHLAQALGDRGRQRQAGGEVDALDQVDLAAGGRARLRVDLRQRRVAGDEARHRRAGVVQVRIAADPAEAVATEVAAHADHDGAAAVGELRGEAGRRGPGRRRRVRRLPRMSRSMATSAPTLKRLVPGGRGRGGGGPGHAEARTTHPDAGAEVDAEVREVGGHRHGAGGEVEAARRRGRAVADRRWSR